MSDRIMTKEMKIEGEITFFKKNQFGEWTATFTEKELLNFIKRIKRREVRR
ncbi:MAG: hypothetical protein HY376_03200 [Candidatus Blackburnbacteria bacterium]|nr:hypothetical protein [Candidatus Blackburnbacteria bacterium]